MKLLLVTFVIAAALVQKDPNPPTIWCDYHSAQFIKGGVEFPNGVCHDVYTHTYYDPNCRCTRTHKATVKCP